MNLEVLSKNKSILYHGKPAVIRTFNADYIVIEVNDYFKTLQAKEYFKKIKSDLITEVPPEGVIAPIYPILSESDLQRVELFEAYTAPLRYLESNRSHHVIKQVIEKVALERGDKGRNKPSSGTVYNWLCKVESNDFDYVAAVNPKKRKRGEQASSEAVDLFFNIINKHYLKSTKAREDKGLIPERCWEIFDEEQEKIKRGLNSVQLMSFKGIKRSTFLAKIKNFDPVEVCIAREGYDVARSRFRQVKDHVVTSRPLELVQIDAVHINVGLLNGAGEYVGMPVVFFAIDHFTRAIMGYVIVYAHKRREDLSSAIELLKVSIQAKCKPEHTNNGWPLYGKPEQVRYDSGIFSSKQMDAYLLHIEVHGQQNAIKSPWLNGNIERFNGTFRQLCCEYISGYEGKRMEGYKDTSNIKVSASVTETRFRELVETFILDLYHQRDHDGIGGDTPSQVANSYQHLIPMLAPNYIRKLNAFRGVETEFTIQGHKGIVRNKVWYNDKTKSIKDAGKLILIYNKYRKRNNSVKVKGFYSHVNISVISVIDPDTGEMFDVPSTIYQEPISLAQHNASCKSGGRLDLTTSVGRLSPRLLDSEDDIEDKLSSSALIEDTSLKQSSTTIPMAAEMKQELEQCIQQNNAGMRAVLESESKETVQPEAGNPNTIAVVKKKIKLIKM